ncbi:bifunctional chorismate mutase/prephenate dehydrogenase [Legionella waltersii]|uniref:chorismate mutase n=1 Tax=Legionella waltersii TaxID=66969 RepID=A0A0W1AKI1_9GAMM|nr:bifunctional chorismate mutase/prephenate dehydrogenase [Legionella waltersii]KTD81760.1 2-methylcitrate synthase [Legionella waltersii]SNU97134.1 2-methylcitrate synthase [Legionella waltersii]
MSTLLNLRQRIDELDGQLIEIIKQRLDLAREVYALKSMSGLGIFDADREQAIFDRLRITANQQGLSTDFVIDIMRRILSESYLQAKKSPIYQVNPDVRKIVIVGANGKMGALFANQFKSSGYHVQELDKESVPYTTQAFEEAGLVLICVPIEEFLSVISELPPLPKHCILADITSVKSKPMKAMLEAHQGPTVGLHPMFGPKVKTLAHQLIVYCKGRETEKSDWLIKQLNIWGVRIEMCSPKQHDEMMAYVQTLNHLTFYVIGTFLINENINLDLLIRLGTPNSKVLLGLIKRFLDQSPQLYWSLFNALDHNALVGSRFLKHLESILKTIWENEPEQFINQFNTVKIAFEKMTQP